MTNDYEKQCDEYRIPNPLPRSPVCFSTMILRGLFVAPPKKNIERHGILRQRGLHDDLLRRGGHRIHRAGSPLQGATACSWKEF